ncbi:ABC transporter ATP-binding protein [Alicyclobacillus dauci]|uniref:ABC transporter ATP-binding protein n=1 Tax=Alicyclobacillus dauci TaxID=1475485 RepID=A0ABY6Z916_9BACL|nr:ABC transporter ATP-binding protein [Alicyclobacillus dauci]WAH39238.1 ABC transporter ATP-binding protein [Alicyclobacillus dauci]
MLEINQLAVQYGDITAVRNVTLDVYPGEVVTLLGSNGAGKSTVLRAICRLVYPSGGDITFNGQSLLTYETRKLVGLGIALVPENRRIFPALTVTQNLEMGAYGRSRSYIREGIEETYELFPSLKRYARKLAVGLSGGEQQMLAIGRALMSRPRLLLLDEPSLGLAPMLVDQVFEKLGQVNLSGTTILLIEQNARMALMLANRAYVMESGIVTSHGTSEELLADEQIKNAYLGMQTI